MVMIIVAISIVAVVSILIFTLALAASARSGDRRLWEDGPLALLGSIRSPSGRPFFASRNAMHDFLETMEDLGRDLRSGRSEADGEPTVERTGAESRERAAEVQGDDVQRSA